ncbi:hypothetical protein MGU_10220 [Metarhizium guizhouense ARSEF 977]|uniref:Uncharacterized protein n=1 Tax=Metarhizium guizhouense (strain ARSEF 977) TaxID=1276136 RepID=A0A0B4GY87_METGA|nr:hypothetical protein MGU_10220 [Metarhizium guizhouense ARSEF 977]
MRSCWIDIGARYYAEGPGGRQRGGTEPITLLWKSQCNRHLHESLVKIAPESPLSATHFRSFLLRDTGNVMFKTFRSRTVDAGHPDCRQPGIIRAKAYNSNKRIFGLPIDRNYSLYSSPSLLLAALNQDMIQDLDSVSKRSGKHDRVFTTRHSRESILHAWEANKQHVRGISGPETVMNYGVRKEVTFCLSAILKEWSDSSFDTDRNTHTGPFSRVLPLGPDSHVHCPFWMLPTKDLNDLIFTQAARLVLPLDHLFQEASFSCVVYNFSSERDYNFDKWIWLSTWNAEESRGEFWERRGLGLEAPIKASGMLWIPRDLIDWRRGHVALATLIDLYIPRSPLQSWLTSQNNIQGLSTTQLTVEYIVQEWAGEAFQEHRDQKGHELADRIAGLCAEETAREYNLHLLDKVQSYWDRARAKAGRKGRKLPASLPGLQRAWEDVAADRSRIVTARTIWEIYNEAWPVYAAVVPDDDADMRLPAELPC